MSASPSVLVLAGGISHERDISLRSGRLVADGLLSHGLSVDVADPDAALVKRLHESPPDVVWPVLHGASGEDGTLRSLLEMMGLPYVGSSSEATRLAWDKPSAKTLVSRAGVQTPPSIGLSRDAFRELGAESVLELVSDTLGFPLITKPSRGGSAQGVSWVSNTEELRRAMVHAFTYSDDALVERQIIGTEICVAIVDTGDGPQALPGVEIDPVGGRYTFEARYTAGETRFFSPPRRDAAVLDRAAQQALVAHDTIGLRDLSRIDFIVDDDGECWFLEASVMPGLTETSTVALALDQAGFDVTGIYAALAEQAAARA
ncbi:D-alanine--D-alanine ligase [Pontimonas sp.]|uniref:D-alanine--D-alanine ligase family protein n=1 Tax=Pontimonas sp. TaxID=2304492 RepID=UPI0028704F58|nr:D-alanine--D-alanine ligase [Pontimonas sp.]MDR9434235.1 D-alanine--D-alanine ligase [Pontimonas sp.]